MFAFDRSAQTADVRRRPYRAFDGKENPSNLSRFFEGLRPGCRCCAQRPLEDQPLAGGPRPAHESKSWGASIGDRQYASRRENRDGADLRSMPRGSPSACRPGVCLLLGNSLADKRLGDFNARGPGDGFSRPHPARGPRRDVQARQLADHPSWQIVVDAYYAPYAPNIRHDLRSVTKSFIGTLTAIEVQEGLLDSVDHPVVDLFADRIAPTHPLFRCTKVRIWQSSF
jgi:hypothetical protein